ncbi:non-hydrolyzing UDP-N-acetylglucosamine 2-epimerase, partial [Desulfofundulus sp.]|uniref:non-hydrolyzing UDP-N-acetylglucosamine 2-epimerase n=1 Tax=Desulfofundulus sp. TaxID=2282750 RepID=UPI003C773466
MLKVLAVFGTRPEAIKMAPLIKELQRQQDRVLCRVAVTAQHREMLDQVLYLFRIVPDHDLDIMRPGQSLFDITRRSLDGLERVMAGEKPDLVLVHGDTTTTFVAALAAFYFQIPVGHVEAGLRTGDKYSPFPEEINRHLTAVLADLHFAPTATARDNLLREGVAPEKIFVTGNTVIDALLATVDNNYQFKNGELAGIDFQNRRVLLVTTHRRENLGEPMREIYLALRDIVALYPDVEIVFPVHMNPAVRGLVREVLGELPRVHLTGPLAYQPFVNLMNR